MDFKKKSDRDDWERLNKFLQERQSQINEGPGEGPEAVNTTAEAAGEQPD